MYRVLAENRPDRYRVSVEEYKQYHRNGFLVVRNLVSREEVETLKAHGMGILRGDTEVAGIAPPDPNATEEQLLTRMTRIHMLHRVDEMSEQFLLHPRLLDVVEVLIGPDVLALQTMLFLNPPGKGGQGWHQDAYYITTFPDTLMGAWLALDRADEENGCLWVAPGSNHEPIYPDVNRQIGYVHPEGGFEDIVEVSGVSHLDDASNALAPIAKQYEHIPVCVKPGDVIFFHHHLLHRSWPNQSKNRWRRAFVNHYCNARSWVPWNHGAPFDGDAANNLHILARGTTHLPYAKPLYGTRCAALEPPTYYLKDFPKRVVAMDGEMMMMSEDSDPSKENFFDEGRKRVEHAGRR